MFKIFSILSLIVFCSAGFAAQKNMYAQPDQNINLPKSPITKSKCSPKTKTTHNSLPPADMAIRLNNFYEELSTKPYELELETKKSYPPDRYNVVSMANSLPAQKLSREMNELYGSIVKVEKLRSNWDLKNTFRAFICLYSSLESISELLDCFSENPLLKKINFDSLMSQASELLRIVTAFLEAKAEEDRRELEPYVDAYIKSDDEISDFEESCGRSRKDVHIFLSGSYDY